MIGELYTANLLKISPRARAVATEMLGLVDREEMLKELRQSRAVTDLARALECREEPGLHALERFPDVFSTLAARLSQIFDRSSLPRFRRSHLVSLVRPDAQNKLAAALGCRPQESLETLFRAARMESVVAEVKRRPPGTGALDPEALLYELFEDNFRALEELELRYEVRPDDWGSFLEKKKWLAADQLKDFAERHGWPSDASASQRLASLLELRSTLPDREEVGDAYDSLAMVYLQQMIASIVYRLREAAVEQAETAEAYGAAMPMVARLPAWIELYERQAISLGLQRLFTGKKAIGTLIDRRNVGPRPDVIEEPQADKHLMVPEVQPVQRWRKLVATFEVQCYVEGDEQIRTILRCVKTPVAIYYLFRQVVPGLKGEDLSQHGGNVGERLLNTPVAISEGLVGRLSSFVEDVGPGVIAQCVVLCGKTDPARSDVAWVWTGDLSRRLPYKGLAPENDCRFERDIGGIVEDTISRYEKSGRPITVVP